MLGYYPPSHPRDGKFHKIEVRVTRPGLRVVARRGYASPRARTVSSRERDARERERIARTKGGDQTSSELRAMLDSLFSRAALCSRFRAHPFKNTNAAPRLPWRLKSTPAACNSPAEKTRESSPTRSELSLFGINAQGKPLQGVANGAGAHASSRDVRAREAVRPAPQLAPRSAARTHQVRVGVRESGAGEMGTVFYDLDVPDFWREPLS